MRSRRSTARHRPFPRSERVNEALREVVADKIERLSELDDRLSLLTVTGVVVSSDLARATVLLDSLDAVSSEALIGCRGRIQSAIARRLRMKRTPQLDFVADPVVERADRVEEIMRRLRGEDPGGAAGHA